MHLRPPRTWPVTHRLGRVLRIPPLAGIDRGSSPGYNERMIARFSAGQYAGFERPDHDPPSTLG